MSNVVIDRDVELAMLIVTISTTVLYGWWKRWSPRPPAVRFAIMITCCFFIVGGSCSMGAGYTESGWWITVKAAGLLDVMLALEIVRLIRLKNAEMPTAIVLDDRKRNRGCCDGSSCCRVALDGPDKPHHPALRAGRGGRVCEAV